MNSQTPLVQTNAQALQQATQAAEAVAKKANVSLIKTIVIVILGLVSMTFIGLFLWTLVRYNDVSTDVGGQIATAVAEAKEEQALMDEELFAEREKDPYRIFSGPADYGQLTFEYPKTWSVYIASDASNGGDFSAYFNPIEVNVVSNKTLNALRLSIRDKAFETVASEYQKEMEKRGSDLSIETITVGGVTANRYSGTLPGTEFNGYIVIFKIRDKTAVLQTDSVLFEGDFNRLLSTITFNL